MDNIHIRGIFLTILILGDSYKIITNTANIACVMPYRRCVNCSLAWEDDIRLEEY